MSSSAAWANRISGYGSESPAALLPNPRNARRHPDSQTAALAGVLAQVGIVQNVIVNRRTGLLVDGHARVELARRSGQASVPVTYVDLSPAEEATILATLDPIAALADYDAEALSSLLAEVTAGDAAVEALLDSLREQYAPVVAEPAADPGAQPDRAAELAAKWGTERGRLWAIGAHRLLCGDSTDADDVERLMGGEMAGVVLTDPPYGMNLDTDWSDVHGSMRSIGHPHRTSGRAYERVVGDESAFDPAPIFAHFGYCAEMFLWGADYYAERIPERTTGSWLVWDKRKESQSEAIGSEFELCWSRQRHKRRMLRHDWFGFLSSANGADARHRQHPTQKPVSLFVDILQQWGAAQSLVADPFLGSGTTMVAAEQLGRRCYGLEIDPGYAAVVLERMAGMGLSPELVA